MDNVDVHSEILRKQVMVSQFVNAVGCTPEQATTILQRAQWHFEAALSLFFSEHTIPPPVSAPPPAVHQGPSYGSASAGSSLGSRMASYVVPTNTPATPPQLPDTLAAFAQMKASSPAADSSCLGEPTIVRCQAKAQKR